MTTSPFGINVDRVPQRRLGSTTVRVGEIGLGCMGLTGVYAVENRDDKRSEAAVHRALDLGMSYLDTSDSFGPFGNERFLGQALIRRRADAVLATKVGVTGRSDGTYHLNGTPEHIRTSVDESLRRLRTDELDVYLLQAVDPAVPVEETWGAMAGLVAAGKVRTLGVRSSDVAPDQQAAAGVPGQRGDGGAVVLGAGQPAAGRLDGRAGHRLRRLLPPGPRIPDRRHQPRPAPSSGRICGPSSRSSSRRRCSANRWCWTRLREVARAHGVRPGQVALAWLLNLAPNVLPIPGSTDPIHVAMNAGAAHLELTREDLDGTGRAGPGHRPGGASIAAPVRPLARRPQHTLPRGSGVHAPRCRPRASRAAQALQAGARLGTMQTCGSQHWRAASAAHGSCADCATA